MKYRGKILIALGMWLSVTAPAGAEETADSTSAASSRLLSRVMAWESSAGQLRMAVARESAGAMFYASPFSLSSAEVKWDYLHRDEALITEEGRGHSYGSAEAQSYMRLSRNTVVWGDASFRTGMKRDVRRNNAADFDLIGPYVFADSVGGNLTEQRYRFSGGYSGASKGWTWGAYASYTACIDYRNRDPRDKIVVSDLKVNLGGSHLIGRGYAVSLGGTLRVYNQESDIDFYNPNNLIRLYAMTGLGGFYPRFSGNGSGTTAYSGLGVGGSLTLIPMTEKRVEVFASARFMFQPVKQTLRDFNNLELTRSDNYQVSLQAGVALHAGESVAVTPQIEGNFRRQLGYENIFGSSVGNSYEKIGTRRNYRHDHVGGALSVPVEVRCSRAVRVDVTPAIDMYYSHEDTRRPRRVLEATRLTPSLKAAAHWQSTAKLLWSVEAIGSRTFSRANRMSLPGLDPTTSAGATVLHNFDMLTSDATSVGGELRGLWIFSSSMALNVALSGCHYTYKGHGGASQASVSASLIF